jgi:ferritin-like metal-binding protein YciE
MASAAQSPELKNAFTTHLAETQQQIKRLDQVFQMLGKSPERETCPAMKGLIKEGQETISASGDPRVKDAALIASAQRAEHYEISAYGTLRTLAQTIGRTDLAELLQQTLDEEGNTDKKLTRIAESQVNPQAAHA